MSQSLEYQKFCESITDNSLGYFIKKYQIPKERIDDLILSGGRRSDSKIVRRRLDKMSPRSDWSVIGWSIAPNSKMHSIALYNYNAKAWQVFQQGRRVNNWNYTWENILKLIANTIDKNNPVVELLDNNWKTKLTDTSIAALKSRVYNEPPDKSYRDTDFEWSRDLNYNPYADQIRGRMPIPRGRASESLEEDDAIC